MLQLHSEFHSTRAPNALLGRVVKAQPSVDISVLSRQLAAQRSCFTAADAALDTIICKLNWRKNLWPMVIATRYRNRRSAAGAGPLLWGLLLLGESFEVFKKKTIRLIVCGLNTTNIRFSFTFLMKMEMGGQQSRWTEPQGSGQSPNAGVSLMRQWRPVSYSIFKLPAVHPEALLGNNPATARWY